MHRFHYTYFKIGFRLGNLRKVFVNNVEEVERLTQLDQTRSREMLNGQQTKRQSQDDAR